MAAWRKVEGQWRHGPWFKVLINSVFRFFQPRGPGKKFVMYTRTKPGDPPKVVGYGFGWITHL